MRVWRTAVPVAILFIVCAVVASCTSYSGNTGVENRWRSDSVPEWIVGETTEKNVVDALGPPSQLISLERETVYYYLREESSSRGLVLLVYNWSHQELTYDRAIFFFDRDGKLTTYSYSPEALPWDGDDQ